MRCLYTGLIFSLILFSCCTLPKKNVNTKEVIVIEDDTVSILEGFITERSFEILSSFSEIQVFKIENSLIKGSTNEYSNKSKFIKNLDKKSAKELLLLLLKDSSYDWKRYSNNLVSEPQLQLIIKNAASQVNVMYDSENKTLSFFTLEGPSTIIVSEILHESLIQLL